MNSKLKQFLVALSLCTLLLSNFQVITVTSVQEEPANKKESSDTSLETVEFVETTDQLNSEGLESGSVFLEDTTESEVEGIAEVIEASSSQADSEELPLTSQDETQSLPQVSYQVLDDNTVYLAGTTGAGLEVRLTDSHSQVLASTISQANGDFQLVLDGALAANQQVLIEVLQEQTVLWSESFVVKFSGLAYEMTEEKNTWLFDITTSPNRLVELSDVEGVLITSVQTNEHGFAQLQVEQDSEIGWPLKLSVYDKDRLIRSIEVTLDESVAVSNSVDSAFNKIQKVNGSVVVENEAFVITNVTQEADGFRVKGHINGEAASVLLTGLLEALGRALYGGAPTYYLTLNDGPDVTAESISDKNFDFHLKGDFEVGSQVQINLRAKGKYRLLLIIPVGDFDELISSLVITIPGKKIAAQPHNVHLQKNIQYEENMLITRTDSQAVSEQTQDYIVDIYDNKDSQWELYAEAVGPLTNENDAELAGSLFFKDGQMLNTLENTQVLVGSKAQAVTIAESMYRFSWPANEGIVIQTNPFYAQPNTTYTTQIRWTISKTP